MTQDQAIEMADELEDMADQLAQVIDRISQVERGLPDGGVRERIRQVRAQLEQAFSDDNEWLGRNPYTLTGSIEELRGDVLR